MSKLILVRYNDRYGNGTNKTDEVIVKSKADFKRWLKEWNAERKGMGAMKESEDEFDLIEIEFFQK